MLPASRWGYPFLTASVPGTLTVRMAGSLKSVSVENALSLILNVRK